MVSKLNISKHKRVLTLAETEKWVLELRAEVNELRQRIEKLEKVGGLGDVERLKKEVKKIEKKVSKILGGA